MTMEETQKRCPNGHVMQPDWTVCPYCAGDREAKPELARTVKAEPTRAAAPEPSEARKTRILDRPATIDGRGWLVALDGPRRGRMHVLDRERSTIGAGAGCEVVLDDPAVSERHASVRYEDGVFQVTDLDSTNGTFVNDERVQKGSLADGDRVRFGESEWIFKCVVFDEGES